MGEGGQQGRRRDKKDGEKMRKTITYLLLGAVISVGFMFVLGIPTAVIPNPFFRRMLPAGMLDYLILTVTSLLIGAYISAGIYHKYHRRNRGYGRSRSGLAAGGSRDIAFTTGTIPAVLGFICPVCNALLVAAFGATALMTYFEPARHYIGFAGIAILSALLYYKVRQKDCCTICKHK